MIKKCLLLTIIILFFFTGFAQNNREFVKEGLYTYIYKLTDDQARYVINHYSFDQSSLNIYNQVDSFLTDSGLNKELLPGNYLFASINEDKLNFVFNPVYDVDIDVVNSSKDLLLRAYSKNGNEIKNASITIRNTNVPFDTTLNLYRLKNFKREGVIELCYNGNSYFYTCDNYHVRRYNSFRLIAAIATVPLKLVLNIVFRPIRTIKVLFFPRGPENKYFGYVVTNKPKYLPKDTVKIKAYIVNRQGKPVNKKLLLKIKYENLQSHNNDIFSKLIKPQKKGVYNYEFVLGDTLPIDKEYDIEFYTKTFSRQKLLRNILNSFRLEDYQLNETSYNLALSKEKYFENDTVKIIVSGRDVNNFPVKDARVKLKAKIISVNDFNGINLFIPKDCWEDEVTLQPESYTDICIPNNLLPKASVKILITAEFNNSNNETHTLSKIFDLVNREKYFQVSNEGLTTKIEYVNNGKSQEVSGFIAGLFRNDTVFRKPINFPYQFVPDNDLTKYYINSGDVNSVIHFSNISHFVTASSKRTSDSVYIYMKNPRLIDVSYIIYKDQKLYTSGTTKSDFNYILEDKSLNSYFISYRFKWAGIENEINDAAIVYNKLLNVKLSLPENILPGNTEEITIKVEDYKGKPVSNVDLTAFSINEQFPSNNFPDIYYLDKMKRSSLKGDNDYSIKKIVKNNYDNIRKEWVEKALLLKNPYYQLLYPKNGLGLQYLKISSNNAQFFPYLVTSGRFYVTEIVWIDDNLLYWQEGTVSGRNSLIVKDGWHKIAFKVDDRIYSIDSVLLKKGYKLELTVSKDSVSKFVRVQKTKKRITNDQAKQLKQKFISLDCRSLYQIWMWQGDTIYSIKGNYSNKLEFGPFNTSIPINYRTEKHIGSFMFDSIKSYNYDYKTGIISSTEKIRPPINRKGKWSYLLKSSLGDTALVFDDIFKVEKELMPESINSNKVVKCSNLGYLYLKINSDSIYDRIILKLNNSTEAAHYFHGSCRYFEDLTPGIYTISFIDKFGHAVQLNSVEIKASKYTCINTKFCKFYKVTSIFSNELYKSDPSIKSYEITGKVKDLYTGEPIPYAKLKLINRGNELYYTTSDQNGSYSFSNIYNLYYTIEINKEGYNSYSNSLYTDYNNKQSDKEINFNLIETQYENKPSLTYYTCPSLNYFRYHKINKRRYPAILNLRFNVFRVRHKKMRFRSIAFPSFGNSEGVRFYGSTTLNEVNISNGARYSFDSDDTENKIFEESNMNIANEQPDFNNNQIQQSNNNFQTSKTKIRSHFVDYAYWQPNLMTDKNGEASFIATFPDNITSWGSYVAAIGDKKQSGIGFTSTKAFKILYASLSLPRFLLPGDTANIIGKSVNYGSDSILIQTRFLVNNEQKYFKQNVIKNSLVESIPIYTTNTDSVSIQYELNSLGSYSDGEKRSIPVYPLGTEESHGKFIILENDTFITYKVNPDSGQVHIMADGNFKDFLLDDLEKLKNYPYYCMEQTASKLKGLLMEKYIKQELGIKWNGNGEIQKLIKKLEKGQLENGAWGWWENSKPNVRMTCYILESLYKAKEMGYSAGAYDKGILFIKNYIGQINAIEYTETKLAALNLLANCSKKEEISYFLNYLNENFLSLNEKYTLIRIKQKLKIPYSINDVLKDKKESMLGNVYWGNDNPSLFDNSIQTSLLAYEIIKNDSTYLKILPRIRGYFFELKYNNNWRNTLEAASILEAIIPDLKLSGNAKQSKPVLQINGQDINLFPYKNILSTTNIEIRKKSGTPVFLCTYQVTRNTDVTPLKKDFEVKTWFEKNGTKTVELNSGEPELLIAEVKVLKKAEFVMIEIPIPAGCSYGKNVGRETNVEACREYHKNKAVIFCEAMSPGTYKFEVEIQPRYTGSYSLNPAKAELMYFPIFFGREGLKRIKIN